MSTQENSNPFCTVRPISVSYSELKCKGTDLFGKIEEGFGPNGLGIISVSGVPSFSALRKNLLQLAPRLAFLPEEVKLELEDPDSRYNFGWSHGKEKLESGKPDTLKGSFYANPVVDSPTTDLCLMKMYPSYCRPNIWPSNVLPELEAAFKDLGKLILNVGLLLAYHCDKYVSEKMAVSTDDRLEKILLHSQCHKGRLLYYFSDEQSSSSNPDGVNNSWCGWHTDHGSLTGLTCGMFIKDRVEIPSPDDTSGLYVKTRGGQIVKVILGEEEIGYQIGDITEILSRGHLCSTPHCVQAPKGGSTSGIERAIFALFMQPNWDVKINFPQDVCTHNEFTPSIGSLTFGQYSEMLLNKYYHQLL